MFERPRYPPYFDKCDIAKTVFGATRDETLVHAMTIALCVKFHPTSCNMKHLGSAEELKAVIHERVAALGSPQLKELMRIFCRRNIDSRVYDRNDRLRSGTQKPGHVPG